MLVCVFDTIGLGSFIYSVGGATIYDRTNARPSDGLTLLFDFCFYFITEASLSQTLLLYKTVFS